MYKIKVNEHGVILQQYGSGEATPVHGSTVEGFLWLESETVHDCNAEYWNGSAWAATGSQPEIWYVWESGGWVESAHNKAVIQGQESIKVRNYRNLLLNESDWTQLGDAPITSDKKAEWATHRQVLRDYPATNNPPTTNWTTLTWPTKPS